MGEGGSDFRAIELTFLLWIPKLHVNYDRESP